MTADVAAKLDTKESRKLPKRVWSAAWRKLDTIAAAQTLLDLAILRVESLKHTKPGYFSVKINDQYRIHFRFEGGNAYDVGIIGEDHTGRRGR